MHKWNLCYAYEHFQQTLFGGKCEERQRNRGTKGADKERETEKDRQTEKRLKL